MNSLIETPEKNAGATSSVVFVVDDDEAALKCLEALISAHNFHVEGFSSAERFLESRAYLRPGCLVTDLKLKGISGLDLLRTIRLRQSLMPAILISGFATVQIAVDAMLLGAINFLEKPFRSAELSQNIVRGISLDQNRRAHARAAEQFVSKLESLTQSERGVLRLLIQSKPHKFISTELDLAPRTVDVRKQRILEKMGVETVIELIAQFLRFDKTELPRWVISLTRDLVAE